MLFTVGNQWKWLYIMCLLPKQLLSTAVESNTAKYPVTLLLLNVKKKKRYYFLISDSFTKLRLRLTAVAG